MWMLSDPYSSTSDILIPINLVLLLDVGFHPWYYRREWDEMRRRRVERRPWLRYLVQTQTGPESFGKQVAVSLLWLVVAVVLFTVWATLIRPV